eukprot:Anaeramoba_ignava/c21393_g5_i1.p1 GENE.c21393_g5_i1~~c21393_g5_i1.p1  ORF type:complete len:855 (+),score=236.78 c21393_g5_i1:631-3195(+)
MENEQEKKHFYMKISESEDSMRRRMKLRIIELNSQSTHQNYLQRTHSENRKNLNRLSRILKPNADQSEISEDIQFMQNVFHQITKISGKSGNVKKLESLDTLLRVRCLLIAKMKKTPGILEITSNSVDFLVDYSSMQIGSSLSGIDSKDHSWKISEVKSVHKRRFLFEHTALEIFFTNNKCVFLNFVSFEQREEVLSEIHKHKQANIKKKPYDYSGKDASKWLQKSKVTKQWQKKQISNFEYLMYLNTLAGRTYQDLSQYPIFPWVIADYKSETLDLSKPTTFRDLSLPIGAFHKKKRLFYEELQNAKKINQFNYSSLYSNPQIVVGYLCRLEPFTSIMLKNPEKYTDSKNQFFNSISETWDSIMEEDSISVQELIPEFFYLSEFLKKPVGRRNQMESHIWSRISDVQLPKWAKTKNQFIQLNREALESDYVSRNLHKWIDLVFGYKQKDNHAIAANNAFFSAAYEENLDLTMMNSENAQAIKDQIEKQGQVPMQLLKSKHPSRVPEKKPLQTASNWMTIFSKQKHTSYYRHVSSFPIIMTRFLKKKGQLSLRASLNKIITFDRQRTISTHILNTSVPKESKQPIEFELDPELGNKKNIGVSFASDIRPSSKILSCSKDGRFIICCGFCDDTLKIFETETSRMIQNISKHQNVVSCLSLDSTFLATGSKDTTIIIWDFDEKEGKVNEVPRHLIFDHDHEITSLDLNSNLDVLVSGSANSTWMIHSLIKGKHIRTIELNGNDEISFMKISNQGNILVFSESDVKLRLFSINGDFLSQAQYSQSIVCLEITPDSRCLISSTKDKSIIIRKLSDLSLCYQFVSDQKVYSFSFALGKFIICGTKNGNIGCIDFDLNEK